jgi:penicillin-binding protein A
VMNVNTARSLTAMMKQVVKEGTGTAAALQGVEVAGKTGTAENAPGKPPHAWFIGFAKSGDRQVAMSVVIENGGDSGSETTGGKAAAPVGKAVIQAALRTGGG